MVKKNWLLVLLCVCLCLAAAGCGAGGAASPESDPSGHETVQTDPNPGADSSTAEGEAGVGVVIPGADFAAAAGDIVELDNVTKVRIPYTGNRSSVVYITSAADLPDYRGLEQYDDAFFEEHALLLVTETVNSGSIDVGIISANVSGLVGTVTLYHEPLEEGTYGTSDMATWAIWAEVEAGLNCRWAVANPALEPDTVIK